MEPAMLKHRVLGQCEIIRREGAVWIVRSMASGQLFRFDSMQRREFEPDDSVPAPENPEPTAAPEIPTAPADVRHLRKAIESLRTGLPPHHSTIRHLALVSKTNGYRIERFLTDVQEGGAATVIRGAYGQGKSLMLSVIEDRALDAGFMVARTEIDASENQLNKPYHVYRDLMRNLKIPGGEGGAKGLATRTAELLDTASGWSRTRIGRVQHAEKWLKQKTGCRPLAWLLSDPRAPEQPLLLGLLAAEPNVPVADARRVHLRPGTPQDWPAFTAATQGDFASFVLSGIGRLAHEMGYKGLLLIFDEMEKWQDLNWAAQSQAGNLLGGLLWGATEPEGSRQPSRTPASIAHSGRAGGFQFSTVKRCYMGIVIAMTPRGEEGPENTWKRFGPIDFVDLYDFDMKSIREYVARLAPVYTAAYGIGAPPVDVIAERAIRAWRESGSQSTRIAMQSIVAAFDDWREDEA